MQDAAAEPLLQIVERGNPHPLTLYADDDLAAIVLWLVQSRPLLNIGQSYKVTIDVGERDISGDVQLKAKRLKRAS
jgi:hypothetical protein